jgi:hypothetical protein
MLRRSMAVGNLQPIAGGTRLAEDYHQIKRAVSSTARCPFRPYWTISYCGRKLGFPVTV